jgi:hypothetical protein
MIDLGSLATLARPDTNCDQRNDDHKMPGFHWPAPINEMAGGIPVTRSRPALPQELLV